MAAGPNNKKFRSTYGLDAGDEKLINVAMADRTNKTDGVSVGFLIQENTVQYYDPTRTYIKGFAVINNERIWVSNREVPKPVDGKFDSAYWDPLRTDPRWVLISSGTKNLRPGDYISVDSAAGMPIELVLPTNMVNGDTIVLRDIGGRPGYGEILIKSNSNNIRLRGVDSNQIRLTIPYSELLFVYNNNTWNVFNTAQTDAVQYVSTDVLHEAQSGQMIIRQYKSEKPINVTFPKNANHGDIIHFVGMDPFTTPYYNLVISTFDAATSVGVPGQKTMHIKRALSGYFVFDNNPVTQAATWRFYDSDATDRTRIVSSDTRLLPNETVSVQGTSNTVAANINLTLPTDIEPGDQITIAMNYIRKLQTVYIRASGTDKIRVDESLLKFPKRSNYPPDAANWNELTFLTIKGNTDNAPTLKLTYIVEGSNKYWLVINNIQTVESVDPALPARVGVIALATQAQANLEPGAIAANPLAKEVAITPETLSNRTALTTRTGIARVALQTEVQIDSTASHSDSVIITPLKLNQRTATETRRGLAEIADAGEVRAGTDDSTIVTPKKLAGRVAAEDLTGIAALVKVGGLPPTPGGTTTRDTKGTNIYDFTDHSRIVTPKVLREYKATDVALGTVYTATEQEVIGGVSLGANYPLAVTPEQLHKKTATTSRIGFIQIATDAEVLGNVVADKAITPKALSGRTALENRTGIARMATQAEFDAGASDLVISTPLKIKTRFNSTARTSVNALAGLVETGTLWDHYTLDILDASETQRGTLKLASSDEVIAGTDTTKAVTAAGLHSKTSTNARIGLIQIADNAEVATGTIGTKAVVPSTLKNAIQVDTRWEATTAVRGTVKVTTGTTTWTGDDTVGNANANLESFAKTGVAITPYEFNRVLRNYMPLKAKAVDAELLDGIDSTQFVRRDIDQTVEGNIVFNKNITVNGQGVLNDTLTVRGVSNLNKQLTIGTTLVGYNVDPVPSLKMISSANGNDSGRGGAGWIFATSGIKTGEDPSAVYNPKIHFGYNYTNTDKIDFQAFEIGHRGDTKFNNTLDVVGIVNTSSVGYRILGIDAVTAVSGITKLGTTTRGSDIVSSDAGNIRAYDAASAGAPYLVMTTKNRATILDPLYVKKSGDTMTGKLTANAGIHTTVPENIATNNGQINTPTIANTGTWSVEISNPTYYTALPPYLVQVMATNPDTGALYIKDYEKFNGPGTLSQFGASIKSIQQIWSPRPTAANMNTPGHSAGTNYIRHFDANKNIWGGWARMYTSNTPPLASDVGALASDGSNLDNLRINQWLQIGNVRIEPDPVSKSVKFTWIENP